MARHSRQVDAAITAGATAAVCVLFALYRRGIIDRQDFAVAAAQADALADSEDLFGSLGHVIGSEIASILRTVLEVKPGQTPS